MNRRLGSSTRHPLAKKLADHGPVAGTPEFGIDLVADEMEKGKELGITDSPGVGYVSFGEAVLECKDWVRGDLPEGSITEGSLEPPTSAASA